MFVECNSKLVGVFLYSDADEYCQSDQDCVANCERLWKNSDFGSLIFNSEDEASVKYSIDLPGISFPQKLYNLTVQYFYNLCSIIVFLGYNH